jgi:hypothetical protein
MDDLIRVRLSTDPRLISQVLGNALVYLRGITQINADDSPALKQAKAANYQKGLDLYKSILAAIDGDVSQSVRDRARDVSQRVRDNTKAGIEAIRSNDIVRIGRWGFGPDETQPTNITVSETYGTQQIQTMRSEVDVTYRTPRSVTKITVDLVFTGAQLINSKMRPFLAEMLTAPITTIESPMLSDILINSYASPELEAEIKTRVIEGNTEVSRILDGLSAQSRTSWDRLKEILQTDDFVLEFLESKIRREAQIRDNKDVNYNNRSHSLDDLVQLGIQIPVAITNIAVFTDPKAVNTLHVQIVFIRYHAAAFGLTGLQFRDVNGDPTPDINNCPWIPLMAERIYLNPNKEKFFMDPFAPGDRNDFVCTWKDLFNRSGRDLDSTGFSPDGIPGYRQFPSSSLTDPYAVESVQVVIDFGVALLPVLGSKYPAVQLMGCPSFQAKVILATTSKSVLREFHVMKDHLDAIARNLGAMGRDEEVYVQNAVLNSLSAKRFVISSVETYPYPGSTNAYRVEVDLTHSRYSRRDTLRNLILEESGAIPTDLLRSFLQYLYTLYQKYAEDPTKTYGYEVKAAVYLLFGTTSAVAGNSGNGLVNTSTLTAGAVRGALSGRSNWNTSKEFNSLKSRLSDAGDGDWFGPNAKIFTVAERLRDISPDVAVNYKFFSGEEKRVVLENPTVGISLSKLGESRIDRSMNEILQDGFDSSDNGAFDDYDSVPSGIIKHQLLGLVSLPQALWTQIIEVILEVPTSPRAFDNSGPDRDEQRNRVWSREQILNAYQTVAALFSSGRISAFAGFEGLKKYMQEQELTDTTTRQEFSNYPDLMLPTYEELFVGSFGLDWANILGPVPYVAETPAGTVELWHKFAPTYQDLGKLPPGTFGSDDPTGEKQPLSKRVARKISDHVEPGFFYYHDRVKSALYTGFNNITNQETFSPERLADIYRSGANGIKVLHLNRDTEDLSASVLEKDATFWDLLKEKIAEDDEEKSIAKDVLEANGGTSIVHVVDNTGKLVYIAQPVDNIKGGRYKPVLIRSGRPVYFNEELGVATERYDATRARAMMVDSLSKSKDTMYWPIRHYPAFRLYFVEFDDNAHRDKVVRGANAMGVRLIDDLYSTNAVLSISVTSTKEDAPVARIQLLNTSGQFDQDQFITPEEQKERATTDGRYLQDDEGEDYLSRIRLQTGTGIVLKMGYSSDPADLDTVFTGQIVEVEHGDVVTIICQGYKAELFQEVNYHNNSANGRVALREVLNKMTLPHLGRVYDIRDVSNDEFNAVVGTTVAEDSTGFFDRHGWIARKFGGRLSTVDRNIWWESADDMHGFVANAVLGTLEKLNLRADREWLFHKVTGWDAVQEICRHHPGLVADVRPYGNEATLFVGYPEQIYHYREPKLSELFEYDKYVTERLPVDITTVSAAIIGKFWNSKYAYPNGFGASRADEAVGMLGATEFVDQLDKIQTRLNSASSIEQVFPSLESIDAVDGGVAQVYWSLGKYDLTADWEYLERHFPELTRVLFAYFFKLRQESLFGDPNKNRSGGVLDGVWRQYAREWMSPLVDLPEGRIPQGWDESELVEHLTENGKSLYNVAKGDNAVLVQDYASIKQSIADLVRQSKVSGLAPDVLAKINAEVERANGIQENLITSIFDNPVNPPDQTIGGVLWTGIWRFRAFLHYFVLFMKDGSLDSEDKRKLFETGVRLAKYRVPPGFRVFRTHHMVWDSTDIIANNIRATMSEMANTVAVYAPFSDLKHIDAPSVDGAEGAQMLSSTQKWLYFPSSKGAPFLPNIDTSQRKLYVAEEPNANLRHTQANCLVSNLAIAMRPMYRGELKIVGRHVQPWDIINIYDNYNCIYGPIEVDRVTHEFSRDTGWITTIEPHLYAIANDASDFFQVSTWHEVLSVVSRALDVLTWVGVAIAVATGVGAALTPGILAARAGLAGVSAAVRAQGVRGALKLGARQIATAVGGSALGAARLGGRAVGGAIRGVLGTAPWLWARTTMAAKMIAGLSVFNQVAAPSLLNAFNNIAIMAELNGRRLPIYIKPLVHKGIPMLAGLRLRDQQILTFGDLAGGAFRDMLRAVDNAFSGTPDSGIISIPTR